MNTTLVNELNDAITNYISATNTHDFGEVAKCLAPNAQYWFSNANCSSREEIEDFFLKAWLDVKEEVYSAHNIEWIAVSDQVATCIYNYKWVGYCEGTYRSGGGRATNVFVKKIGKWLLVHEHLSANPKI